MDFNELFDRLWGMDGLHPFGDPFKFEDKMGSRNDEIEVETCEFVKGDFKTIITCKFNKRGFLIGTSALSTFIGNGEQDLEALLQKALEKEDYELAAAIKRRIDGNTDNREEQDGSGS